MHLDIRGNGLQPSHEMSNLGNIPLEEDHEGLEEPVHQNQWSKLSHLGIYRFGNRCGLNFNFFYNHLSLLTRCALDV